MDNKIPLEKIKGCLYGGALGDALGYPVGFLDRDSITKHYGPGGIRNLKGWMYCLSMQTCRGENSQ